MQAKIRRYQNNLIVCGSGVIAFGIWNVVKLIIFFDIYNDPFVEYLKNLPGFGTDSVVPVYVLGIVAVAIDLALIIFTGRYAMAVGKGKKKGKAYMVTAGILVVMGIVMMVVNISALQMLDIVSIIITVLIMTAYMIALIELIVSSIKLKALTESNSISQG